MKRLIELSLTATFVVLASAACGGGDDGGEAQSSSTPAAQTPTQQAPAPETPEAIEVDAAMLPQGVTVEMVQEGYEVFHGMGICYTCHTQGGVGGPLAPDLTDQTWINVDGEYASIIELVNTGVPTPKEHPGAMLPKAGMPLTDDQIASVSAYTYMLSR
ncbi:MAG: c-type cytochrome [Longimicrobiales bacterium]